MVRIGLKKLSHKVGLLVATVSALVLVMAPTASAVDGVSFSDCPQQFTWGTYDIKNSKGQKLGYMRVYSCQYGFFVRTANTIGSASWTNAVLIRSSASNPSAIIATQSAGGKYASVTNQLTKQSRYCYKAHGSISTVAYGSAGRSFTFACL
jgi:hypothetical protein